MANVNLQIRIPEEVDTEIEGLAPGSKSEFVRQAIREKVERLKAQKLEAKWIKALKKSPEDSQELDAWLKAEHWEPL